MWIRGIVAAGDAMRERGVGPLFRLQRRMMARKTAKHSGTRKQRIASRVNAEKVAFARDLRMIVEMAHQDEVFQDFLRNQEGAGSTAEKLFPDMQDVVEAELDVDASMPIADEDSVPHSSSASEDDVDGDADIEIGDVDDASSKRIIPDERTGTSSSISSLPSSETNTSTFASNIRERHQEIRAKQMSSARGQRFKEILEDYFSSSKHSVRVRPKGSNKAFSLQSIGVDVVSVVTEGRGLCVVTWTVPSSHEVK